MLLHLRCPLTISLPFLLLVASVQSPSFAGDTLRSGDTLTRDATLVSANGTFEFGFFPAANSTDRFYLGMWYHSITPRVVVWVGNRDAPFANTSGQIKLADDGNLVVLYGGWNTTWSTGLDPSWGGNFTAKLREDGNLVIQREEDADGKAARWWQSFDFPTDTLLSGMKLYVDKTTGDARRFRSWRTATDPADGNYTLGLDARGVRQLVMLDRAGRIRWRSGLWTGAGFNGVDRMRPLYDYGFQLNPDDDDENRIEFGFTYFNNTRMRFVLLPNGTETTYVYDNGRWKNIWQQPVTECELYNHCGANAVCDLSSETRCRCLSGFEPRSSSEWAGGNRTGGCKRRTALRGQREGSGGGGGGGEEEDGFKALERMKLPDEPEWDSLATDANGCKANCAGNGSCTAYTYLATGGCFRWTGELVDIFRFADGSNGANLYVRLAGSEFDEKNNVKLAVIIASAAAGTLLLLVCIFFCWKYKYRIGAMWKAGGKVDDVINETTNSSAQHEITIAVSEADDIHSDRKPFELPMFSFELVEAATENFNEANELGRGGFGNVYKGKLPGPCGEEIAVKRLSRNSGQGEEEFKNEMTLIAKLQHVNLVRLLGCCVREEEKMLIYEYMPNKSLDAFIFDPEKQPLLDWRARFNIIEGVARGLLYLHRDSRLRIVHRDLKASNILLDQDMNPKISDFGMARIFGSNQHLGTTTRVVGTFGYMSPEYAMEGLFSTKSDVYSFGAIVLEIVTGMKNTKCRSEEYPNRLGYAWKMWEEGQVMELVDPSMRDSCNRAEVLRCIHIALLCVQDHVADRPTMPTVVLMLGTETEIFTRPKRPLFANYGERSPERMAMAGFSVNNVTITELNVR